MLCSIFCLTIVTVAHVYALFIYKLVQMKSLMVNIEHTLSKKLITGKKYIRVKWMEPI
jgi:hypothetical protein